MLLSAALTGGMVTGVGAVGWLSASVVVQCFWRRGCESNISREALFAVWYLQATGSTVNSYIAN